MFKLFSGSANPTLSEEVSSQLHISLSDAEVVRFGDSEVKVTIQEDVKDEKCVVIQPTANPTDTNLMELCFFCDALRRGEAKRVIGVVPYFGYARQNIQHRPGESLSVTVVIHFLESIGFNKIYAFDLHDEATEGIFTIPFKPLSALPLLAQEVKKYLGGKVSTETVAVISPDQGGIERARRFGAELFGTESFPLVVVEKKRNENVAHQSKALDIYGEVKGKIAILVDDIVTSGGTLIHAAELCMNHGAKNALAAIVHHDFSSTAPQKIQESIIERFFTTNTIQLKEDQKFEKLHEVSIASIISEELKPQ